MPLYRYKALNSEGYELSSTIEAVNDKEAIRALRNEGLFPFKLELISGREPAACEQQNVPDKVSSIKQKPLLPPKAYKCKFRQGINIVSGYINIFGGSLTFQSAPNDFGGQENVTIKIDDISEIKLKGLLRKTMSITTKNGTQMQFIGNVGFIAQILKFELS